MRNFLFSISIVLLFLLLSGQMLLAQQTAGTIRGGVYLDHDGDGQCVGTGEDIPVPNIDISFTQGNNTVSLYSGSNGTYGLPIAAQGVWTVTAQPNPNEWRVTSAPSRQVNVSEETGLVQLGVNFCVKPVGGSTAASSAANTAAQGQTAVPKPTPSTPQEITSAQSEALLTNPPEPIVPDELPTDEPVELIPEADWLAYLNLFREIGELPALTGEQTLSEGSLLHSRYMVVLDEPIAHKENPSVELYTPPGDTAAQNSNLFATSQIEADYKWAVNFWMSAPFHQVPLLDPELTTVGYGNYNQNSGTFTMAAVIDVLSDEGGPAPDIEYPLYFPAPDSETWIVRHSMYEWPDPLTNCPGFIRPTGPPIVLQIGDGSEKTNVTSYSFSTGALALESCILHEGNYVNPDPFAQQTGRTILGERDAIVLLPRQPLEMGKEHTVQITANGVNYVWSFTTRQPPGVGE